MFAALRAGDVLLHHPYDSFTTSVHAFIEQAATDPARAGDQAHALPDQRRVADRRRPGRGRPVRQAGAGRRRDQGALRRAGQHPLGPQARAGRLPRRLRPGRAEDALQARARRAVRAGRPAAPLRATSAPATTTRRRPALYEDLGLLTADPDVGADVADLFNHLSGYTRHATTTRCWSRRTRCEPGLLDAHRARVGAGAPGQAVRHQAEGQQPGRRDGDRRALRRVPRPVSRSTCWSAGCARCAPGCRGCPRRSGCAASSAGSSSTRGSTGSPRAATTRCSSAAPT